MNTIFVSKQNMENQQVCAHKNVKPIIKNLLHNWKRAKNIRANSCIIHGFCYHQMVKLSCRVYAAELNSWREPLRYFFIFSLFSHGKNQPEAQIEWKKNCDGCDRDDRKRIEHTQSPA